MPSKPYDPTKPTVYLDNSTLCDAFRAHVPADRVDAAYEPLRSWIERVAQEANLCVSLIHLHELARWNDLPLVAALVSWLETMPLLWMHSDTTLREAEHDIWTKRAARVPSPEVQPFAPSLARAFHGEIGEDASEQIGRSTIANLVAVHRKLVPHYATVGADMAAAVRADRADVAARRVSSEVLRDRIESNRRVELRTIAQEANERLTRNGDAAYAAKTCTGGEVQDLLVELYERDLRVLPLFRLSCLFNRGFVDGVTRRQPGSKADRAELSGAAFDHIHLSGAAYCDAFTCDRATADALGDFRVQIRRRRQLAVGRHPGGITGFVMELMSIWP